jgi:predicted DCC family thiol-disulfide oxidoreductase YuxK
MKTAIARPYSYRLDPDVPSFADDKPIIVFDGHCVFCSGWARFVVRNDRRGRIRLLAAQSALGRALYRHYQLPEDDYTTNLLLVDGLARFKSDGTLAMFGLLDWPWPVLCLARIVPTWLRDRAYGLIARNRLRWFGRSDTCFIPQPAMRERFLE